MYTNRLTSFLIRRELDVGSSPGTLVLKESEKLPLKQVKYKTKSWEQFERC